MVFAGVLGGSLPQAPHGAICAALLPHVIRANVLALAARQPASTVLPRYEEIAQAVVGPHAKASDLADWLEQLCVDLKVPSLREMGLEDSQLEDIARRSSGSSSMKVCVHMNLGQTQLLAHALL